MSTLVDDSMSALSERLTELEQTVQARMTTPITEASATHAEPWTIVEQALMSEIDKI